MFLKQYTFKPVMLSCGTKFSDEMGDERVEKMPQKFSSPSRRHSQQQLSGVNECFMAS